MLAKRKGAGIDACFICGNVRPVEMDHVIPRRHGGTLTVPLCVSCHDAKDRMCLDSLGIDEVARGVLDTLAVTGPSGRLLLLKIISIVSDALERTRK